MTPRTAGALALLGALAAASLTATSAPSSASFTADQAWQGRLTYYEHCAECHGGGLQGNIGPALAGGDDRTRYESGADVYAYITAHMPHGNPGGLSRTEYVNVMAFIYQQHHHRPGTTLLTARSVGADGAVLGP